MAEFFSTVAKDVVGTVSNGTSIALSILNSEDFAVASAYRWSILCHCLDLAGFARRLTSLSNSSSTSAATRAVCCADSGRCKHWSRPEIADDLLRYKAISD